MLYAESPLLPSLSRLGGTFLQLEGQCWGWGTHGLGWGDKQGNEMENMEPQGCLKNEKS